MKDKFNIRVLCQRCLHEMLLCGYRLNRTNEKRKEACWKCQVRQGFEYRVR